MGERENAEGAPGSETRPVVYCLIPAELAPKLLDPLRHHFAGEQAIEVVVERRERERRGGADRRVAEPEVGPDRERRSAGGPMGRRIGERRAALTAVVDPPELPRRARRHADQILFFERLGPSSEEAENRDTERLIARIQAGDRELYGEIYTRYFDRLYGYLRVALHDVHEAEDATQQVFTQVLEKLPEYERRGRPFRNWLFAIARNYAVSQLRRSARIEVEDSAQIDRRREAEAGAADVEEPEVNGLGWNWLTDRDLLLFVERLPQAQRQVLAMRYMMDLTNAEIAKLLGRSTDDVKTLHYRAVSFLRKRLAAIGRETTRREGASIWPVFRQVEVLRHRRFALH